jgi:hypothetical protein
MALAGTNVQRLHAQSCSLTGGAVGSTAPCNATLQDVLVLQPHVGIGLAGGNPIPGASSTLGMRIGRVPRITLSARVSGVDAKVRDKNLVTSINLDAGVGIFSGLALFPTIGGFGSIDAVASAGKLYLPAELSSKDPASWALGLRLGLLRESFTAPGISITGMYRRIGDVQFSGSVATAPPGGSESYALTDNSVLSVRGVIGKRLFVVGASAGVGYDSYKGDVVIEHSVAGMPLATFSENGHQSDRTTVFANLSWTLLVLNFVAEGGWQEGGDRFNEAILPAGRSSQTDKSTYYGSLAIRVAF